MVGDVEDALTFVGRALALNPNLAGAWVYRGGPQAASEHFARAMRRSPLDPHMIAMPAATAFACMLAGRYDDALPRAATTMWAQNYNLRRLNLQLSGCSGRKAGKEAVIQRRDAASLPLTIRGLHYLAGRPANLRLPARLEQA